MANSESNPSTHRDPKTQQFKSFYLDSETGERFCPSCQEYRPPKDFYAEKRSADGLKRRCKKCHAQASYASRRRNSKDKSTKPQSEDHPRT